jgi:hypothetical protein
MLGFGVWLLPPDDARTRITARVLPSLNGFVLAGGF